MTEREIDIGCARINRSLSEHICLTIPAAEDWACRERALRRYRATLARIEEEKS